MKRYQTSSELCCWLLALSLIGLISIVVGKPDCSVGHHKCREGQSEIYRDTTSTDTLYHCCKTGSKEAIRKDKDAESCSASDCVSISNSNVDLCASTGTRTVSSTGHSFSFEEAVRDDCKLSNGQSGVEALCCPQNSTDLMLTTLIGAEPHEFPHFARLEVDGGGGLTSICGGTVYNERYIITASHCVVDKEKFGPKDNKKMTIFLDILIEGKKTDNKYGVQEVTIHPNASLTDPDTTRALNNDIALLKLNKDIKFSDRIQALPLAPVGFQPSDFGDTAIIVGFGDTDTLTTSKKLQKADGYIRDTKKSLKIKRYRKHKNDADQLLFIGGYQDGIASPSGSGGDSGGPAVCRDKDGNAVLCGLTSFGPNMKEECEQYKDEEHCFPTSYVKVDHYRDWIEETAGTQENARVMNQPLYGKDVPVGKYPSQVRIETGRKNDDKSCGGTLIAKDVVLTAAHCVADDSGKMMSNLMVTQKKGGGVGVRERVKSIKVLDGFQRIGEKNGRARRIAVFAATATWDDPYYKNDLALVKLEKGLKVSSKDLSKLAMNKTQPGAATEVAWVTDQWRRGNLTERQFSLMSYSECQKRMSWLSHAGYNIKVDRNIVCGVENYSGGSKCDRTTGGGLFCGGGNTLCGVQVFRLCEFAVPSAFMDVGMNSDWIEENMKKM